MFRRRSGQRLRDITTIVEGLRGVDSGQLARRVAVLRADAARGANTLLPDCLALTAEAASRVTGDRAADADLAAGVTLCAGAVLDDRQLTDPALVLALPTVLHAVAAGSAHLITPTQQDARRHATWLRPVADLLGLRVSLLEPGDDQSTRRGHHQADIVCGEVTEFAYDVLRDWLTENPDDHVLPGLHAAVVDQVDVVLLDRGDYEPMISTPLPVDHDWHQWAADLAARLRPDEHVTMFGRSATLSAAGFAEALADLDADLEDHDGVPVFRLLNSALTARLSYRRGVDYDVVGDEVVMPGAPEHLVEALTVHEGLPLTEVKTVLAVTTVRRHVLSYPFRTGIGIVDPTAARCLRELTELRVSAGDAAEQSDEETFADAETRLRAVRAAATTAHDSGRPVVLATGEQLPADLADRAVVLGPSDPVPTESDAVLIGIGSSGTRRDVRLARAAGSARWYRTEAEPTVTDLAEQELIRFYQDEPRRIVADIRETQLAELTEYCAALFDEDAVSGFQRVLHGYVETLVKSHGAHYAGLRDAINRAYPSELPAHAPSNLKTAVRADADRALAARIRELEDLAGADVLPRLIPQVVRNVRDRNWRGHLVDLDTLSTVCGYSVPANRFRAEFTARAAQRFAALWRATIRDVVAYTFQVRLG